MDGKIERCDRCRKIINKTPGNFLDKIAYLLKGSDFSIINMDAPEISVHLKHDSMGNYIAVRETMNMRGKSKTLCNSCYKQIDDFIENPNVNICKTINRIDVLDDVVKFCDSTKEKIKGDDDRAEGVRKTLDLVAETCKSRLIYGRWEWH